MTVWVRTNQYRKQLGYVMSPRIIMTPLTYNLKGYQLLISRPIETHGKKLILLSLMCSSKKLDLSEVAGVEAQLVIVTCRFHGINNQVEENYNGTQL